jgi:hypothetical protein
MRDKFVGKMSSLVQVLGGVSLLAPEVVVIGDVGGAGLIDEDPAEILVSLNKF